MRTQSRFTSRGVLLTLWGLAITVPVSAADANAAEFAGRLLQSHPTLFTAADRAALDEINRDLREARNELEFLTEDAARERAALQEATATARLTALLEKSDSVRRVALGVDQIASSFGGPFKLSTDEGVLLFRLDAGPGDIRFVTQALDQSRAEHAGAIDIKSRRPGVTWLLMDFYHLPVGETRYPIRVELEGSQPVRTSMTFITPQTGRVKITALDDADVPTPVMMRITSKATGRDRPPSNAVELAGQFDGNGNPTGHRKAYLPGRLGGDWWVVPGPFAMALPPGVYKIAVRRGAEQLPVFDQFSVIEGQLTEKTYRIRRWVDMRALGWYSGDDHVHARITSDDDAERLMDWIRAEDVHVVNIPKMGDTYRTYFEQRGWGQAHRVVHGDYVLSPGQEDPRTQEMGHTMSMNTQSHVRNPEKYYLYDWVADTVHAQGGLFGYAHVAWKGFHVDRDMSINVPKGKVDFAEIMQFDSIGTEFWYAFLNTGFKLTATAGSDVPWAGTVGEVRTYAYLGRQPFSADTWFEAVRCGHTFVTNGPMIEFQVDEALPGDEIHVTDRNRVLHVRARAWGHPERNVPAKLTILKQGSVLREVTATDSTSSQLSLDFTVTAEDGFWIAARVDANDGSAAHTTPIYVTRSGLRFWKYDQVQVLLDQRLHSLSEIEQMVKAVLKEPKASRGDDSPLRQFSPEEGRALARYPGLEVEFSDSLVLIRQQGAELLKRVDDAKRIYLDLWKIAQREKSLRVHQ